MAFDQATRNRLARLVGEARALLTEEFTRQLQLEYGMDPARGEVTALDALTRLPDAGRETARLLRETLAHYEAGASGRGAKVRQEAIERIVREQAFTVLNRLCALRMAEARALLIESVARGYQSKGFQLYARLAGAALGETGDAYRTYLFSLFDEFAVDLPVLFDRFAPEGRLFPGEPALLALLDLINHPEIEPLWAEDETIGWIYQYFNSKEERKAMRDASAAPRNSRELAVRNQFFTPRYVVEFLIDNTLGRIWYEMTRGETSLTERCRYLVRRRKEIFLQPLDAYRIANRRGAQRGRSWTDDVRRGDFASMPETPAIDEIADVALAIQGYEICETVLQEDYQSLLRPLYQTYRATGQLPEDALECWLMLFALQREALRHGQYGPEVEPQALEIYRALRERLQHPKEDASQEELLQRPVFIPQRPLKDPRAITMLDPACGSMHFGLYAFDVYERIYEEAWDLQTEVLRRQKAEGRRQRAEDSEYSEGNEGSASLPTADYLLPTNPPTRGDTHGRTELSRSDRLAKSDGSGGHHISGIEGFSEGRDLRSDESGAAGSGIDSIEHRRGAGTSDKGGVSAIPLDRAWLAARTGDSDHDRPTAKLSQAGAGAADPGGSGRDGSPDSGTYELLGERVDERTYQAYLAALRDAGWDYEVDSGQNAVDSGQNAVDSGQNAVDSGQKIEGSDRSEGGEGNETLPTPGEGNETLPTAYRLLPTAYGPLPSVYSSKDSFLRDVPRLIIERNIHGVDIDPRAVQIAGLSLWLRAQKSWREQGLESLSEYPISSASPRLRVRNERDFRIGIKPQDRPQIRRSNVVCAEPMPGDTDLLEEFIARHLAANPEDKVVAWMLRRVFDAMTLAGEAGTLLKIEDEITTIVAEAKRQWRQGPQLTQSSFLAGEAERGAQRDLDAAGITDASFWSRAEQRIDAALQEYAAFAEGAGAYRRRLFAGDAARGFAFIDLCRRRYDVVLMNPPFGAASAGWKATFEKAYPRTKNDLYAAFVERGINVLNSSGMVGAITSRTGFFLTSFQKWREEVLLKEARPTVFADLGAGVLDAAMVETAAYCLEAL